MTRNPLERWGPSTLAGVFAPAAVAGMAVITTGNHYVIDAVVGVAIALGAWMLTGRDEAVSTSDQPPRTVASWPSTPS